MTDTSKYVRLVDVTHGRGYARSRPRNRLETMQKNHPELADIVPEQIEGVWSITKDQEVRIEASVPLRNTDMNGKENVQKRGADKDGLAQLYFFLVRPIGDEQHGPRQVKMGYSVNPEESISALPPGDLIGTFECEQGYVDLIRDSVATPLGMVKDPEKEDWYVLPEGKAKEDCGARWQEVAKMLPAIGDGPRQGSRRSPR